MMKKLKHFICIKAIHSRKGFVLLEVLIAIALIIIAFITMLGMAFSIIKVSSDIKARNQVDAMLKGELEAARSFRDSTIWGTNGLGSLGSNYGSGFPYYFSLDASNPPKWKMNNGTETIGQFTRHVIIDKVERLPNGDIYIAHFNKSTFLAFIHKMFGAEVAYASTCFFDVFGNFICTHDDPDTYKLTAKVFFEGKTYELVTYLTNWKK